MVTGEQSCQIQRSQASRAARWDLLREGAWRISEQPRLWKCHRFLHDPDGTNVRTKNGSAYYDGLVTCGSIWSCPLCAARIRQRRAGEIEGALFRHLDQGGGGVFLTATFSHSRGERLADLLDVLLLAWKKLQQDGSVRRLLKQLGVNGKIRATEITHGLVNGWHPHLHVALFTDGPLTEVEHEALLATLYRAWEAALKRLGRAKTASEQHGLTLRPITTSGVGQYLAKIQDHYGDQSSIGLEMARSDAKKGRRKSRTPFEILEGAAAGLARDVALWREYEAATKGRRAIEWSRGLKARFLIEDLEDEDLATADVDGDQVVWIDRPSWFALSARKQQSVVLDLAENGGAEAVLVYLDELGSDSPTHHPEGSEPR